MVEISLKNIRSCIFGNFFPGAMLEEPALLGSGRPVMASQVGRAMVWPAGEGVRKR